MASIVASRDPQIEPRLAPSLYQPLDFVVVRVPLLSIDAYHALSGVQDSASCTPAPESSDAVRRALAVGSVALLDASDSGRVKAARRSKVDRKLLRYVIRMSTRPTPFGLFAGVALGRWDAGTNLALSAGPRAQRTRPDMDWLMRIVIGLEADPAIRRHLRLVANSAALVHGGRVFLAERVSRGEASTPPAVSIRATGVVRRALQAAREPVPYDTLASVLLESTAGATVEKVDRLLTNLWEHTLLITDLRPPLTAARPAHYVVDRLDGIAAAADVRGRLVRMLDAAAAWDGSPQGQGVASYRSMVTEAASLASFDRSPFQVDSAVALAGDSVSIRVGQEAARAAELLLRLSPLPKGPAHLAAYRHAFTRRYGAHREVGLLELLDPNTGLGPPLPSAAHGPAPAGLSPAKALQRHHALMELALHALRERTLAVDLDEPMIQRLETWDGSTPVPPSLDLYVSLDAASTEALDAGQFRIVVGPNVGSLAAGRTLGRFADLLPGAQAALQRAADAEHLHAPHDVWAELVYQPRRLRLANVSIRPNVRPYEIAVGVSAARGAARVIPLDELSVGVRDGRFYLRWPAAGQDVVIATGHMLTPARAPAVCRFLSEIGRDGCCQLTGFQWGPAAGFPFLPRLVAGRIVLAPSQWRLGLQALPAGAVQHPAAFADALACWRTRWQVPRHVYLSAGDNRLLLDLAEPAQTDELRRALQRLRGDESLVVSEVLPDLDHAWVRDSDNRPFVTELVVPIALRAGAAPATHAAAAPAARPKDEPATRLRSLGSEWLFAKLYGHPAFQDDLLAGPLRRLVEHLVASRAVDAWFFVRYSDPEPHIRLRFRGQPERLLRDALPALCNWVRDRIQDGWCHRLVLDTYEREIERFGGADAMSAAETLFAAESHAVVDLLHMLQTRTVAIERIPLAVLTVDALLDGLGLDANARRQWCLQRVHVRNEASREYRQWKGVLRALLGDAERLREPPAGPDIAEIIGRLRNAGVAFKQGVFALASRAELTRAPSEILESVVHLHLNRLVGGDRSTETRVVGLLWRVREGLQRSAASRPGGPGLAAMD